MGGVCTVDPAVTGLALASLAQGRGGGRRGRLLSLSLPPPLAAETKVSVHGSILETVDCFDISWKAVKVLCHHGEEVLPQLSPGSPGVH